MIQPKPEARAKRRIVEIGGRRMNEIERGLRGRAPRLRRRRRGFERRRQSDAELIAQRLIGQSQRRDVDPRRLVRKIEDQIRRRRQAGFIDGPQFVQRRERPFEAPLGQREFEAGDIAGQIRSRSGRGSPVFISPKAIPAMVSPNRTGSPGLSRRKAQPRILPAVRKSGPRETANRHEAIPVKTGRFRRRRNFGRGQLGMRCGARNAQSFIQ